MTFHGSRWVGEITGIPLELNELLDFHLGFLREDILPWWTQYALDRECGGLFSCIQDDGAVVSTDKYVWSQARGLWTFSGACNRIEARREWLEGADIVWKLLRDHGQTESGRWMFRTDRQGNEIEGPVSIQTDAFAIAGLVEYAQASATEEPLLMACRTADAVLDCLSRPGSYTTEPYPLPETMKANKVAMQFSLAFRELARATGNSRYAAASEKLTREVLEVYWRPEWKCVVEYRHLDDSEVAGPMGSYASPGHGYETGWYQLENLRGEDRPEWKETACQIIRHSLALGWDQVYGGLFLGTDARGGVPHFKNWETKIWWPATEAFCALLMAFEETGDVQFLEDYQKIHNWAFEHFTSPHGEWTQRLSREGKPLNRVVALPVKDPFHLPRGIIYSIEALERIRQGQPEN